MKLAAAPRPRPKGHVASSWSQRTVLVDLPTPVDCDTRPTYAMSLLPGMMKPPPQDIIDEVAGPEQLTAAPVATDEGRPALPDYGDNPGLFDESFPGVVSPGGVSPGGVSPGGVSPGGVSPGQPPGVPPEGGQPPFVGPDLPPIIGPPLVPLDELPITPGVPPIILPPGVQPPLIVPVDVLPPGLPPGGQPPPVTAIPEPATWLAMILGFVGIGAALRWRRRPQPKPSL